MYANTTCIMKCHESMYTQYRPVRQTKCSPICNTLHFAKCSTNIHMRHFYNITMHNVPVTVENLSVVALHL